MMLLIANLCHLSQVIEFVEMMSDLLSPPTNLDGTGIHGFYQNYGNIISILFIINKKTLIINSTKRKNRQS